MNPQLRQAIQLASSRKWTPAPPRQTPSERTASAIAKAANNPVRTGFLWSAGSHLADIAFGLVRMLLMMAMLAGLAYGAWSLLKRDPQPTGKPPAASSVKTPKAGNGTR